MQDRLKAVRQQIDSINNEILQLINRRAELAKEVGDIKREANPEPNYYRPEREAQILRELIAKNPGPVHDKDVAQIFRAVIASGLALQQPLTIAYLGPQGTFSQAAVAQHFGNIVGQKPVASLKQVFRTVESGEANYGVVPIENSTTGLIKPVLDLLISTTLKICGEIEVPIQHHLLVKAQHKSEISRVYSHEQSLQQCQQWLEKYLPNAQHIAVASNAQAAQLVQQEDGAAAIAGSVAAQVYGLEKQYEHIQDNPNNSTRFAIIGEQVAGLSGVDKTSLVVAMADKPGSLSEIIGPFSQHNVNLLLIDARPLRHPTWECVFYIEIEGHCDDDKVAAAIATINQQPIMLTVLGSYPKSVEI